MSKNNSIEATLDDIVSLLKSVSTTLDQPASYLRTKRLLDIHSQLEDRIRKLEEEASKEEESHGE